MFESVNKLLDNENIKVFLILFTGIFSGYVLQPVPQWFNNLTIKSQIFKFFILFSIGFLALHPMNKDKLIIVIACSIIILEILQGMRKFDI